MQLVTLEIHPILYRYAWANSTMLNQMHCHRTIPFHNHTVGEEHISYSFVGNNIWWDGNLLKLHTIVRLNSLY